MAVRLKLNRVCCLSLSQGCLLFGLLDLAIKIYLLATMLKLLLKTSDVSYKFLLVVAVIGVCTNLFMMSGSILDNYWSILPYLVWEILLIVIYIVMGLILLGIRSQDDNTIDIVMIVVLLGCLPTLSVYMCNVVYNRYQEIKEKQSAPSELVTVD